MDFIETWGHAQLKTARRGIMAFRDSLSAWNVTRATPGVRMFKYHKVARRLDLSG